MLTYDKTMKDRRVLVNRIKELTGEKVLYTKMPRCAFLIGPFTVERDGRLVVGEGADDVLDTLLAEGLVVASTEATGSPDSPDLPTSPTPSADDTARDVDDKAAHVAYTASLVEVPPPSFPLNTHTAYSIRNLLCMIYTQGPLMSKATGGEFHVDGALADKMKNGYLPTPIDQPMIHGLTFTETHIVFSGFPRPQNINQHRAFDQLAEQINLYAISHAKLPVRTLLEENERYIFRLWLIRLGMQGPAYASTREILLTPLSGSMAFKDQAMKDRYDAKHGLHAPKKNVKRIDASVPRTQGMHTP